MNPDLEAMRRDVENARQAFRAKARAILFAAYQDADHLSSAVGEASVDQIFDAWLVGLLRQITSAIRQAHPDETASMAAIEQWITDMEKGR